MSYPPTVDMPNQELTRISVATIPIEIINSKTLSQIKFYFSSVPSFVNLDCLLRWPQKP